MNIFTTYIHTDENIEMAKKLKSKCKAELKKIKFTDNYKNGKTTFFEKKNLGDSFMNLNTYVLKNVQKYLDVLEFDKNNLHPTISAMWISEMYKGGNHQTHNHYDSYSHISGTFYVESAPDSAPLVFYSPDFFHDPFVNLKSKTYNQFNSLVWRFPSKPGLLLLWKSNLLHSVDYNNSDKRIAISFNIKL
tara:strand:- start:269 stop:838 length:570 start_codon:yes stop_codon:yes gene_type:complete